MIQSLKGLWEFCVTFNDITTENRILEDIFISLGQLPNLVALLIEELTSYTKRHLIRLSQLLHDQVADFVILI